MSETVNLRDPNAADKADALYRQMIDAAAESGEHKTISNRDPRHAGYLMQTFFGCAKERVRIYTTQLARQIDSEHVYASPELIEKASALLAKPDSHVSIIVQGDLDVDKGMEAMDHPLIAALSHAGAHLRVSQYTAERQFGDFAVMDETAYRAEVDGDRATAIANFGDPEFAAMLAELFDSMETSDHCRQIVP